MSRSRPAAGTSSNADNVRQGDTSDDDDVVILKQEQKPESVVEAVDLSDDADEPGRDQSPSLQDSRTAVQNGPRRFTRSSIPKTISPEDSDDEDGASKEEAKAEQKGSVKVIYSLTSFFNGNRNRKLGSKVTTVHFPGSKPINLPQFISFCDANRQKIKTISVEAVNWQILKEIATRLKELEVLVIPESRDQEDEAMENASSKFTFPARTKLVEVVLNGTNNFLKNETNLSCLLASLPKTVDHLVYIYSRLQEVDQLLNGINSSPNLKNLKLLTIQKIDSNDDEDDKEELALHRKQIQSIANLNLAALASLELNCGIWEDVKGMDLTLLLSKFAPTLRHFTIAGNWQGVDMADNQVKFHVPKMPQLRTFNMGHGSVDEVQETETEGFVEPDDYEDDSGSESDDDSTGGRLGHGAQNVQDDHVISLDKIGTTEIEISFSPIPTLKSLSLGTSIHIDKIQPSMFPKLKTLHIRSNWTVTMQIPTSPEAFNSELHEFKFVRDLRLPDFIQDQFFMLNIRKMFPALKRITMKYPTAKCLRYFFHGMANSSLETLRLKTAFDFRGMLEDALFPQRYIPLIGDDSSLIKLLKLENAENNDVFLEFIRDKGIELPIWTESTFDDDILRRRQYGIENLTGLKKLILEHLRKKPAKIPLNNKISHKHPQQTFDEHCRIGFWRYPLHENFVKRDIPKLKDLDLFHPQHPSRQFQLPCEAKACEFNGQYEVNYNDENCAGGYIGSGDDDEGTWDDEYEDAGSSLVESSSKKRKRKAKRDFARDRQIKKVKKEEPTDGHVKPRIEDEVRHEVKTGVK